MTAAPFAFATVTHDGKLALPEAVRGRCCHHSADLVPIDRDYKLRIALVGIPGYMQHQAVQRRRGRRARRVRGRDG